MRPIESTILNKFDSLNFYTGYTGNTCPTGNNLYYKNGPVEPTLWIGVSGDEWGSFSLVIDQRGKVGFCTGTYRGNGNVVPRSVVVSLQSPYCDIYCHYYVSVGNRYLASHILELYPDLKNLIGLVKNYNGGYHLDIKQEAWVASNILTQEGNLLGKFGETSNEWLNLNNWIFTTTNPDYRKDWPEGTYYYRPGFITNSTEYNQWVKVAKIWYNEMKRRNKQYVLYYNLGGRRTNSWGKSWARNNTGVVFTARNNDRNVGGRGYGDVIMLSRKQLEFYFG